ncbi:unnamed protein product [Cuscuta europaea]|uniref:BED-type domain-containing protein n=1 Tax=Cuscuta europaea TaxID=41803 RepID=A0A9P0YYR1_CUSEU|nr:unnamed protein product [Cuscuta europaea]
MMMSDEQLQHLLSQNDPRFAQEQQFPTTVDEEELKDDDAEEDAGGDGTHGTPDDEQELEDEGRSTTTTQIGKKSKSPIIENNYTKKKDENTEKCYASCNHCNKEFSLGTSGGYGSLKRHLKSAHFVEYAKIDKGKGKQTQISRFFHQRCACHILNLCVQDGLAALGNAFEIVKGRIKLIWAKEFDDNPIDPKQEFNEVSNLFHQLYNEFHAQYGNAPPPMQ